jgi:hypothetical protein
LIHDLNNLQLPFFPHYASKLKIRYSIQNLYKGKYKINVEVHYGYFGFRANKTILEDHGAMDVVVNN